jgi:hypothetical protein
VAVTVDKPRQYGLAGGVDNFCAGRNGNLTSSPHALETPVLDDNDGVLEGRSSAPIDQRSALNHQSAASHRLSFEIASGRATRAQQARAFHPV